MSQAEGDKCHDPTAAPHVCISCMVLATTLGPYTFQKLPGPTPHHWGASLGSCGGQCCSRHCPFCPFWPAAVREAGLCTWLPELTLMTCSAESAGHRPLP